MRAHPRANAPAPCGSTWLVHLDDGSSARLHEVSEVDVNSLDGPRLRGLAEDMRAALRAGRRRPLTLEKAVSCVERMVQLNHCGEPVRRLWELRQQVASAASCPGAQGRCTTPAALLAVWEETVGLAAQVAFTLRERLDDSERRQAEEMLRGFCELEEQFAAAHFKMSSFVRQYMVSEVKLVMDGTRAILHPA
ncbi:hypothetical protein GPECTOR_22g784 [Gonium pectorale]|uniref:Uncharacterized protein n=1 Tax=Gonium pectorale TaxID=33097 RepID=A0A150GH92_GONPE|nr:hypothetical protein GPECTOR_22g784 [Gonium pectorale]|eukprot:KXZ49194.1 hypothetical protein GPECTOR_22g784 [Gonium pectorale]